ncbi:MAG: hypothetical protein U0166_01225 [Acidobacteriota bacterium]
MGELATGQGPGQGDEVVGDDAPRHVAMESGLALVDGAVHAEQVLEDPDLRFDAGSPLHPVSKPPLLLKVPTIFAQPARLANDYVSDAERLGQVFVPLGVEARVPRRKPRSTPKDLDVVRQRGFPCGAVGELALEDVVAADQTMLYSIEPDEAAKLVRLAELAFPNDLGVRFEDAEDLPLDLRVAVDDSRPRLLDDLRHQRDVVLQLGPLVAHVLDPSGGTKPL